MAKKKETTSSRKLAVTKLGLGIIVVLGAIASLPFADLSPAALRSLVMGVSTIVLGYCGGNVGEWFAKRGQ